MRRTCLDMVHELARRDDRVIYIGSDPGPGTMAAMGEEFPSRCLIEGISEANVIGMAAGLAMEGYIPYVNTIATFLTRRCYEQVALDLCLHKLPVRLIGNGGGMVYAPLGPSHTAVEDMAIMRALPDMTVVALADADEMRRFMPLTLDWPGPIYIRLARGGDPLVSKDENGFEIGKAILMRPPGDVLIVSTGSMLCQCLKAAETLQEEGISAGVLHVHTIKPLDGEALHKHSQGVCMVATVEEHLRTGGLNSAVLEALSDRPEKPMPRVMSFSIPDVFTHRYGSQSDILEHYGLTSNGIAAAIAAAIEP